MLPTDNALVLYNLHSHFDFMFIYQLLARDNYCVDMRWSVITLKDIIGWGEIDHSANVLTRNLDPGIQGNVTWHAPATQTLWQTKDIPDGSGPLQAGFKASTWPPNPDQTLNLNPIKHLWDVPEQDSPMDSTWHCHAETWTQNLWGCPVESCTRLFAAEPLSPVDCDPEPFSQPSEVTQCAERAINKLDCI